MTPSDISSAGMPEPAFRLTWSSNRAEYRVSKPNIGRTDCYTADQMHAYGRACMPTWMPIESAPKDGTPMIVADIDDGKVYDVMHGYFEVLTEDEEDGPWDIRDGHPWCSYEGRAEGTYFCSWLHGKELDTRWRVRDGKFPYTHWMPIALPASPIQGATP